MSYRSRKMLRSVLIFLGAISLVAVVVGPYLWLIISSISTAAELTSVPPHWIPDQPTLVKFVQMFSPDVRGVPETARMFKVAMSNSFVVSASVTVITLACATLSAYAFARLNFPLRDTLLMGIVGTRMLPAISTMISLYVVMRKLNLLDSKVGLVILYLTFTLPFAIWILTGFFQTIPQELEEAARIDGTSRLGALFRVVLPLSTPGLVSAGIFVFMAAWDEFFFPLIFTSTYAAKTVPVAISEFAGRHAIDYAAMAAGGVVASIPPVVLAFIFQRYIIAGLTSGSVKG